MNKFNTLGRCCIAAACIIFGISGIPESIAVIAIAEIVGGLCLFVKYRIQLVVPFLIGIRIVITLIFVNDVLSIFQNVAIIGGLFLLINNSGQPLLEIMKPDIRDLPEYKTKL